MLSQTLWFRFLWHQIFTGFAFSASDDDRLIRAFYIQPARIIQYDSIQLPDSIGSIKSFALVSRKTKLIIVTNRMVLSLDVDLTAPTRHEASIRTSQTVFVPCTWTEVVIGFGNGPICPRVTPLNQSHGVIESKLSRIVDLFIRIFQWFEWLHFALDKLF